MELLFVEKLRLPFMLPRLPLIPLLRLMLLPPLLRLTLGVGKEMLFLFVLLLDPLIPLGLLMLEPLIAWLFFICTLPFELGRKVPGACWLRL